MHRENNEVFGRYLGLGKAVINHRCLCAPCEVGHRKWEKHRAPRGWYEMSVDLILLPLPRLVYPSLSKASM